MPKTDDTFAARLRALRARAGLTRRQLAGASGCSLRAVIAWENGEREPLLSQAAKLAAALAVPVGDLSPPALPPHPWRR